MGATIPQIPACFRPRSRARTIRPSRLWKTGNLRLSQEYQDDKLLVGQSHCTSFQDGGKKPNEVCPEDRNERPHGCADHEIWDQHIQSRRAVDNGSTQVLPVDPVPDRLHDQEVCDEQASQLAGGIGKSRGSGCQGRVPARSKRRPLALRNYPVLVRRRGEMNTDARRCANRKCGLGTQPTFRTAIPSVKGPRGCEWRN